MSTVQQIREIQFSADTYARLIAYLGNLPYKVAKPVIDNINSSANSNASSSLYTLPPSTVVHLLDNIMLREDVVFAYISLRQEYERAVAQAAAEHAEHAEHADHDNIVNVPNTTT